MFTIIGLGNPGEEYKNSPHNVGFEFIEYFFNKNKDFFSNKRYEKKIKSDVSMTSKEKIFQNSAVENKKKIENLENEKVQIIFPRKVYMNNSGICISQFAKEKKEFFLKIEKEERKLKKDNLERQEKNFKNNFEDLEENNEKKNKNKQKQKKEIKFDDLLVIHDDIDLPFGKIKIVFNSGHGGHNGIRDIIKVLGNKKFIRIKFGVGIVSEDGILRKPVGKDAVSNYLVYRKMSKKNQKIIDEKSVEIEKIIKNILKNGYQKAMNDYNRR